MTVSIPTFVTLALASLAVATPTVKRHGPGKRGLVWTWYNGGLDPGRLNDGQGTVNLIYDYETTARCLRMETAGLAFIGMQRCTDCDSSPIAQLAARQKQLGFSTIFTLNEPDQGAVTPAAAAQWYKDHINPLHWYGQNFAQFQAHVNDAHARFPNNKLVITEFALQNPPGGQADQCARLFRQAFAFLDAATFVEMYFPFAATSMLYNNDGTISAVGQLLLSA
ncbi:hypothetical protein B0H14DRAFT_2895905 [Mycena olivaceomarginata]|nr:hypothetical protein B0H14DRAFT_2895905 [Mycena olivaceomarginata]